MLNQFRRDLAKIDVTKISKEKLNESINRTVKPNSIDDIPFFEEDFRRLCEQESIGIDELSVMLETRKMLLNGIECKNDEERLKVEIHLLDTELLLSLNNHIKKRQKLNPAEMTNLPFKQMYLLPRIHKSENSLFERIKRMVELLDIDDNKKDDPEGKGELYDVLRDPCFISDHNGDKDIKKGLYQLNWERAKVVHSLLNEKIQHRLPLLASQFETNCEPTDIVENKGLTNCQRKLENKILRTEFLGELISYLKNRDLLSKERSEIIVRFR